MSLVEARLETTSSRSRMAGLERTEGELGHPRRRIEDHSEVLVSRVWRRKGTRTEVQSCGCYVKGDLGKRTEMGSGRGTGDW